MIVCSNCSFQNPDQAERCQKCGSNLADSTQRIPLEQLRALEEATIPFKPVATHFPDDGFVCFNLLGHRPIILKADKVLLIGRSDPNTGFYPELDLNAYDAYLMGVSRKHAEIRKNGDALELIDLGSSNGTFLREDRLVPHMPYPLYDGDLVRFGKLSIKVTFHREVPSGATAPKAAHVPRPTDKPNTSLLDPSRLPTDKR